MGPNDTKLRPLSIPTLKSGRPFFRRQPQRNETLRDRRSAQVFQRPTSTNIENLRSFHRRQRLQSMRVQTWGAHGKVGVIYQRQNQDLPWSFYLLQRAYRRYYSTPTEKNRRILLTPAELFCTACHCAVLSCAELCCAAPCCTVPCRTMPHCTRGRNDLVLH